MKIFGIIAVFVVLALWIILPIKNDYENERQQEKEQ